MKISSRNKHRYLFRAASVLLFAVLFRAMAQAGDEALLRAGGKTEAFSDSARLLAGDRFFLENQYDSALFWYTYVYKKNAFLDEMDARRLSCRALNGAFKVYFFSCEYQKAFHAIQEALSIAEEFHFDTYLGSLYNNVGNILMVCKEYEEAMDYWRKALASPSDPAIEAAVLNNMGVACLEAKAFDTALAYFQKSYARLREEQDSLYYDVYNNLGYVYYERGVFDSAFFYLDLALENAKEFNRIEKEAKILVNKARLLFDSGEPDSAFALLQESILLSKAEGFYDRLAEAYYFSAHFNEALGRIPEAYHDIRTYAFIKDSVFVVKKGLANQLESGRKLTEAEREVGRLIEEHEIARIKLRNKSIVQALISLIMLLSLIFLFLLANKNKKLNRSYAGLVQKNVALMRSDTLKRQYREYYEKLLEEKDRKIATLEASLKKHEGTLQAEERLHGADEPGASRKRKYSNSSLKEEEKTRLLSRIEKVMEEPEIFCKPDFSLKMLADLTQSNTNYVSQTVNETFRKNFQSYLNEHRIREACRLMADPENRRYSIETIAVMAGFKSKSSFNDTFKRITGVPPSVYLKNIKINNL